MSPAFPVPAVAAVQTKKFVEGATDVRGQPKDTWAAPVTQYAYGWGVPDSREPKLAGHKERVTVMVELLVPESFDVAPSDKVILPRYGELDVLGFPEDMNNGPFGFRPGLVVNLGRVDG